LVFGGGVIRFDNSYAQHLEGMFIPWNPSAPPDPQIVAFNAPLAADLDAELASDQVVAWLSEAPSGATPIAQAYSGHQFGGLSPRLGDGRALLLGEAVDPRGRRWDIHLKGAGRTPFSRGGDGKAALGPMLREYIIGESLHALGIPGSRALAVIATGEAVVRDRMLPGAVLARVAASHLRVGTFEYAALQGDVEGLERLVQYSLQRHYPTAVGENAALTLLQSVENAQAELIAAWMGVGFIHGVLNTDNVTISGESLDFGPCAFLEAHDPAAVFSSIDVQGRYAYGQQPKITLWNLARLASALLPLIDADPPQAVEKAQEVLRGWESTYATAWRRVLRRKLGLQEELPGDDALCAQWMELLIALGPDHTLAFRGLSSAVVGNREPLMECGFSGEAAEAWLDRWVARGALDPHLDQVNPRIIARNHLVEAALSAAEGGDVAALHELVKAVRRPFDESIELSRFALPAGKEFTSHYRTFCGT